LDNTKKDVTSTGQVETDPQNKNNTNIEEIHQSESIN